MPFLNLKRGDRKILSDHDKKRQDEAFHHWGRPAPNITRIYKYLMPNGDDMEIHTVAVKCKGGKTVIKEIVRASVDGNFLKIKDLVFSMMGGYIVDWSPEGVGQPRNWSYEGKWGYEKYNPRRAQWKMPYKEVVNPEVLLDHPRFKYCSWKVECGDILDYLKEYVKQPKIELFSKMSLGRFALKRGFVKRLLENKALLQFFISNREMILAEGHGVTVIQLAFKKKIGLKDAAQRIENHKFLRQCGLPDEVDSMKAKAYMERMKCSASEYCYYLIKAQEVGLDLLDTKNAFPINFEQRYVIVRDQAAEKKRREDRALARKQNAEFKKMLKPFIRLESIRKSGLMFTLPRKTDDLISEGDRLDNCLGDGHYAAKMARGETLIAFVRRTAKPREAFVAVEYDIKQKKITQCYAAHNQPPSDRVKAFVELAFKAA